MSGIHYTEYFRKTPRDLSYDEILEAMESRNIIGMTKNLALDLIFLKDKANAVKVMTRTNSNFYTQSRLEVIKVLEYLLQ